MGKSAPKKAELKASSPLWVFLIAGPAIVVLAILYAFSWEIYWLIILIALMVFLLGLLIWHISSLLSTQKAESLKRIEALRQELIREDSKKLETLTDTMQAPVAESVASKAGDTDALPNLPDLRGYPDELDTMLGDLVLPEAFSGEENRAAAARSLGDGPCLDQELERQRQAVALQQKSQKDTIALMTDNLLEIRGYFGISKRHARLSFWLAIVTCVVGLVLLCLAVNSALTNTETEPAILAAVAGAVAELFAGTSLIVHNRSLNQLNHYYDALHQNEMFLSTVNLVGKLSLDKQDEIYAEIIRNEIATRAKMIELYFQQTNNQT